eukprot:6186275-Pleurochrysis_carterae.AAC.2
MLLLPCMLTAAGVSLARFESGCGCSSIQIPSSNPFRLRCPRAPRRHRRVWRHRAGRLRAWRRSRWAGRDATDKSRLRFRRACAETQRDPPRRGEGKLDEAALMHVQVHLEAHVEMAAINSLCKVAVAFALLSPFLLLKILQVFSVSIIACARTQLRPPALTCLAPAGAGRVTG